MKNALGLVPLALVASLTLSTPAHATPPAGAQESLVELLPARARFAAILRKNALAAMRELLLSDAEMMRELQPYLERSFGIDLTRLEGLALFTMDLAGQGDPKVGLILRIPSSGGALKLKPVGDAGGTPLYRIDQGMVCARTKSGLVLGHEAEVRAVVATERGREAALPRDAGLGRLLAADANDVDLVVAMGPGALPQAAAMGIDDGLFTMRHSGAFDLVVHGDPDRLSGLRAMALAAIQAGLATLSEEKTKATATNDPVRGATSIVLYHRARKLAAELEPKLSGNALSMQYKTPDLAMLSQPAGMAAMVGVLAAIAIPNFVKYQQRAKTSEARTTVRGMAMATMGWATEPGHKPAQLRSTDWAPAARCCGQAGDRCAADAQSFAGPTWKAIGFSVSEPGRYQYRILVEPKAKPARIVVEARGDLDCDGETSSYKQVISFAPDGPTLGELQTTNESE